MEVLTGATVAIILQYVSVSNQHIRLKLTQCYMPSNFNKAGKNLFQNVSILDCSTRASIPCLLCHFISSVLFVFSTYRFSFLSFQTNSFIERRKCKGNKNPSIFPLHLKIKLNIPRALHQRTGWGYCQHSACHSVHEPCTHNSPTCLEYKIF